MRCAKFEKYQEADCIELKKTVLIDACQRGCDEFGFACYFIMGLKK